MSAEDHRPLHPDEWVARQLAMAPPLTRAQLERIAAALGTIPATSRPDEADRPAA